MNPVELQKAKLQYDPQTVRNEEGQVDRKASIKANAKDIRTKWADNFTKHGTKYWKKEFGGRQDGMKVVVGVLFGWPIALFDAATSIMAGALRSPVPTLQTLKNITDIVGHASVLGMQSMTGNVPAPAAPQPEARPEPGSAKAFILEVMEEVVAEAEAEEAAEAARAEGNAE